MSYISVVLSPLTDRLAGLPVLPNISVEIQDNRENPQLPDSNSISEMGNRMRAKTNNYGLGRCLAISMVEHASRMDRTWTACSRHPFLTHHAAEASLTSVPLPTEGCYHFPVSIMGEHDQSPDCHVYWVCRVRYSLRGFKPNRRRWVWAPSSSTLDWYQLKNRVPISKQVTTVLIIQRAINLSFSNP